MGSNFRMSDSAPLYALLIVVAVIAGIVIAVVGAVHWLLLRLARRWSAKGGVREVS